MDRNKYTHDPDTGRKLARDERAALMDQQGVPLQEIQEALYYRSEVATREAISRGRRYSHHLEMARMRKKQKAKRLPRKKWTPEAMIILRETYSNPDVPLKEVARRCSEACGFDVSTSACIGKAYRMELPKRSSQPPRNLRRLSTQEERYAEEERRRRREAGAYA